MECFKQETRMWQPTEKPRYKKSRNMRNRFRLKLKHKHV